jgi:L-ornithine Nalpha-acyltransferase
MGPDLASRQTADPKHGQLERMKQSMITVPDPGSPEDISPSLRTPRGPSVVAGSTEVRLAREPKDIKAAQELRYRVFYEEMGAKPSGETALLKLDRDPFDSTAEHLLVIDHSLGGLVVGTYRLMRRRFSDQAGGFYTAQEYDISKLTRFKGEILELGRSCVDPRYRSKAIMLLLWQGIAAYAFEHNIRLMFGCASLPTSDPDAHAQALSYLHHHHRAPEELRPRALSSQRVEMNVLSADQIDAKQALKNLPPLIKGYLRLGGWVGDGAVVDRQFNTTDVCIIVQMEHLTRKYFKHYQRMLQGVRLQ